MTSKQQRNLEDQRYMAMALMLARRGWGSTAPNPAVGAAVVAGSGNDALVLGRGWTQAGGRPHAETEALKRAGAAARGATLYVTLEPCSHHGRTPPCAEAIIAAGIARVVVGIGDPDARVAGRGIAMLRAAGIEVVDGVLAEKARWVAAGHILRVTQQRPFVQLKLAVSADGRIAPGTGQPVWVTGPGARAQGHLLRAQADAILTGIGTVLADDPRLDCRLPGLGDRSPWPVVLDSACRLPPASKLAQRAVSDRVACVTIFDGCESEEEEARVSELMALGVQVWAEPAGGRQPRAVPLRDLLQVMTLAGRDVTRLLVEGGPTLAAAFLAAGLVDEAVIFRGTGTLAPDGLLALKDRGVEIFDDPAAWARTAHRRLADGDTMTVYQSRATPLTLHGGGVAN